MVFAATNSSSLAERNEFFFVKDKIFDSLTYQKSLDFRFFWKQKFGWKKKDVIVNNAFSSEQHMSQPNAIFKNVNEMHLDIQ